MSVEEKREFHKKLDKIIYFMGTTEEHFKTLNGAVKRHEIKLIENENRFIKVYEDFQKNIKGLEEINDIKIKNVEKVALDNRGKLLIYSGIAIGGSTLISLLVTTKALGFW